MALTFSSFNQGNYAPFLTMPKRQNEAWIGKEKEKKQEEEIKGRQSTKEKELLKGVCDITFLNQKSVLGEGHFAGEGGAYESC